jgi:uncharacterized protein
MKSNNRRNFLKSSLIAITGAPVIASSLNPFSREKFSLQDENKLVYRTLGKTGIKLPVISMGTGDTDNPKLVEAALQEGIKLFATSQYYGNGNNEKMLGEVLKGRKRDSYLVMTSAMPDGFDFKSGMFSPDAKADNFVAKVDESLKRLGIEYLDIMLLPFVAKRESVFFEPYLKVMENIKKQGKAKFIGIATHQFEHEAIRAAVDTKIYDVILTAYNFRRKNAAEIKEALAYAANAGLGTIAMKTMAGAYWDKEKTKPINTRAALKWALQDENIHTTVPGFTTFDQLKQNIEIMGNMPLTEEEKQSLQLTTTYFPTGVYCSQCGECITQCPHSLDIPTMMRSYMYAYGYKNIKHAKQTLSLVNIDELPCNNCKACNVNCIIGNDVKSKIADIARLHSVPGDFITC